MKETKISDLVDFWCNMHVWSQRNNIRFNTSKCKVLTSVTRKKTPIAFWLHPWWHSPDTRFITSTLSWYSHIHTMTAKANKLLGFLKRTCPLLSSASARRSLYLSLVRSQLCYATQVWSPAYFTLNAKVEQVQRRSSRWITHAQRRVVVQRAADFARLTSTFSRSWTQRLDLFL